MKNDNVKKTIDLSGRSIRRHVAEETKIFDALNANNENQHFIFEEIEGYDEEANVQLKHTDLPSNDCGNILSTSPIQDELQSQMNKGNLSNENDVARDDPKEDQEVDEYSIFSRIMQQDVPCLESEQTIKEKEIKDLKLKLAQWAVY